MTERSYSLGKLILNKCGFDQESINKKFKASTENVSQHVLECDIDGVTCHAKFVEWPGGGGGGGRGRGGHDSFRINHKTFLCKGMSIGCLEPLVQF